MLLQLAFLLLASSQASSDVEVVERRRLQGNFITCSSNVADIPGARPSAGRCEENWARQGTYNYPDDFTIQSKHDIYRCEESDLRIILSNGIPDHTVTQSNPNEACEQNYMVRMPLNPTFSGQTIEPSASGMIAMSLNGVPAFGAQENGSSNAADPRADSTFPAVPYYGHAGGRGNWHYHSGEFGLTDDMSTIASDTLLGYSLDGFPIYGPLVDDSGLDECGGIGDSDTTYRYHVRLLSQIDNLKDYCDGASEAVQWGYILGCYKGDLSQSRVTDSIMTALPADCVLEAGSPTGSPVERVPTDAPIQVPTDFPVVAPTASPVEPTTRSPVEGGGTSPNFIVMQPDDLLFFEAWGPPPHIQIDGTVAFPASGLPNLEKLRNAAVQMTQTHTVSSTCGTSRYSTITGRYPSRSSYSRNRNAAEDVSDITIPNTKLQDTASVLDGNDCTEGNLPTLLKRNGYRTGVVGKWHLSPVNRGSVFDYAAYQETVKQCGFDFAESMYAENLDGSWHDGTFSHNLEYMAEQAIDFITTTTPDDEPFFLYLNPTAPHSSGNVLEALNDFDCTKTPAGTLDSEPQVKGMTEGTTCAAYRQSIIDRAAGAVDNNSLGAIWIDDLVGAVLQALTDTDQLDNTFFLFQLDHGQEAKGTLFEPGIRIPEFIHFPKAFPVGKTFNGLVSTVDVAPTILDYAGIREGSPGFYEMDGNSWRTAVETSTPVDRCLYFELDQDRAVRCGCYKYMYIHSIAQSVTTTRGGRQGLATANQDGGELLFNLCNENGEYETSENKEIATTTNASELAKLQELGSCLLTKTFPTTLPDFVACDAVVPQPTAAPVAVATSSPIAPPDPTSAPTPIPVTPSPVLTPSPTVVADSTEEPADVLTTAAGRISDEVFDRYVDTTTHILKECEQRDGPPVEGTVCRRDPKTCLFGEQMCDDGLPHPTVICECIDQTWGCNSFECPSTTG